MELRSLLARRVHDRVSAEEFPVLHAARSAFEGSEDDAAFAVLGVQPMLDSALERVPKGEAKQCLTFLLGSTDLRFRSLKERASMAARVLGVKYDAYRRKDTGHLFGHLLILATEILAQEPEGRGRRSGDLGSGSFSDDLEKSDDLEEITAVDRDSPKADSLDRESDQVDLVDPQAVDRETDQPESDEPESDEPESDEPESDEPESDQLDPADHDLISHALSEDDFEKNGQADDDLGPVDSVPAVSRRFEERGPSLFDTDVVEAFGGEDPGPLGGEQPFRPHRNWRVLTLVAVVLVALGLGAWRASLSGSDVAASDSATTSQPSDPDDLGSDSLSTQIETADAENTGVESVAIENAGVENTGATEAADQGAIGEAAVGHVTDQPSLVVGEPDPSFVPVDQTCLEAGAIDDLPTPAMIEAAAVMATLEDQLPDGACMGHRVALRESAYWQELLVNRRLKGGMIAWKEDPDDAMKAVFLPLGLWQSYLRVSGGDGSGSPDMAGFPTGKVIELADGRFQMEVLGDVVLIAEDQVGTFYWMPGVVANQWDEIELSEEPLGWPTSSVYLHNGQYRVDFTSGFLQQDLDGVIKAFYVEDSNLALLPAGELRGRLITSLDGTAWLVDDDLKRWWVPDGQAWACLGATGNLAQHNLFGYEIHSLDYGGIADCPMSSGPSAASGGGLDLSLYCYDEVGGDARVELFDAGWVCDRATGAEPIDKRAACRWQYGPERAPVDDEADSRHFSCAAN